MRITIGTSVGGGAKAPAPALPTSGLLGAWNFTDAAATAQNPIPGYTSDTMAVPSSPNDPAITGQGLTFDGSDDYLEGSEAYDIPATGTLIAVASSAIAYPNTSGSYISRGLIGKGFGGGSNQFSYSLYWQGTNAVRSLWVILGNASNFASASFAYDWGSGFHCVAGRWNGTKVHLWSDGAQIKEGNQVVNGTGGAGAPLRVGVVFNNPANTWNGKIAFAAVYDRALSDAEMVTAYQALKALLAPAGVSI